MERGPAKLARNNGSRIILQPNINFLLITTQNVHLRQTSHLKNFPCPTWIKQALQASTNYRKARVLQKAKLSGNNASRMVLQQKINFLLITKQNVHFKQTSYFQNFSCPNKRKQILKVPPVLQNPECNGKQSLLGTARSG